MSEFGDYEPDDAFDTEPADPEQVARKLARIQGISWDALEEEQRDNRIAAMILLLAWLRRQGASL